MEEKIKVTLADGWEFIMAADDILMLLASLGPAAWGKYYTGELAKLKPDATFNQYLLRAKTGRFKRMLAVKTNDGRTVADYILSQLNRS